MHRTIKIVLVCFSLAGCLLLFGTAALAATYSGELTAASPTAMTAGAWSTGDNCQTRGSSTPYATYILNHAGGLFVAEMKGGSSSSGTLSDPYLLLYRNAFDPGNPCANYILGDDDGGVGLDAKIETQLPAGRYMLVATSFWVYGFGTYLIEFTDAPPTPVPTLNQWGMILLVLLLAGIAFWRLRRTGARA